MFAVSPGAMETLFRNFTVQSSAIVYSGKTKICVHTLFLELKGQNIGIVLSNFTVPNTFTPNNDGYYDTWVLRKLSKYPNHRMQVFNRYGQLMYETTNFPAGGWDGKYKGSPLPFGTYYYIIELGGLQKPKTGYVTIVK